MYFFRALTILLISISIFGCASPFQIIKDSSQPIGTENYTILPPSNGKWSYLYENQTGQRTLFFGKKKESATLSTFGMVREIYVRDSSFNSEELLEVVKQISKMDMDPRRFVVTEEIYEPVDMFGGSAVFRAITTEDRGAINKGSEDHLIMKTYGYLVSHPDLANVLISADYSERGKKTEIDKNFKENAEKFVSKLKINSKN